MGDSVCSPSDCYYSRIYNCSNFKTFRNQGFMVSMDLHGKHSIDPLNWQLHIPRLSRLASESTLENQHSVSAT